MSLLPTQGNRGTYLTLASTAAVLLVWLVSVFAKVEVPAEVWWSLLGINGASAVRGSAADLSARRSPDASDPR